MDQPRRQAREYILRIRCIERWRIGGVVRPAGRGHEKTEQAERAVDRIRERMGSDAISRASIRAGQPPKHRRSTPGDGGNNVD